MFIHIGSFSQPGVTGNQAITGVGFLPQLVLFFMQTNLTADGSAAGATFCKGAAISSSSRFYVTGSFADNTTNYKTFRANSSGKCIGVVSPTVATVIAEADFVSQDADGFTINWTTVDATARIVNYIALSGLTNVAIGTYSAPASPNASFAVAGLGFKPDVVMQTFSYTTTAPPTVTEGGYASLFSFFTGTQQGVQTNLFVDTANTSRAYQVAKSFALIGASGAVGGEANVVSMDADGFTQNFTTAIAAWTIFYIALKGCPVAIGTLAQPSSTGNQSVSGLGFRPIVVALASVDKVTSASVATAGAYSFGAATSSSKRFSICEAGSHSSSPINSSNDLDRTKVIKMLTQGRGSPTTNAAADFVSLDSGGFTINWTAADATAREVYYLALGSTTSTTTKTISGKAKVAASSYTKLSPTAVAHIGNRMFYVSQQLDTNGNAFSVVYVSDPQRYQDLTQDQNILQLSNQLKITTVAGVLGAIYLVGPHWVYVTEDTGVKPIDWPDPTIVDGRRGALYPNCVEVNSTGRWMWIADKTGLYYFDGAFPPLPISHLQTDIWNLISVPQSNLVIKDDPLRHRVIVQSTMSDTGLVKLLVWDYTNGDPRDPYSVRFAQQDPGASAGGSIEIVQNDLVSAGQAAKDPELWISPLAPVTNIGYFSREQDPQHDTNPYRDSQFGSATPIHAIYEPCIFPSPGGDNDILTHIGTKLRITGAGVIQPKVFTFDHGASINLSPAVNLSSLGSGRVEFRGFLLAVSGFSYRFEQNILDGHFTLSDIAMYYNRFGSLL